MKKKNPIRSELIAPCGMNCAICMGYLLREKNKCPGCRGDNLNKPSSCVKCIIINCELLQSKNLKYCSVKCEKYPCARLKNLDKRYRTKYNMSMIENLDNIERHGIRTFVKNENIRWTCPECGGTICVHRGFCSDCGKHKK
jgi:hypothetical protein